MPLARLLLLVTLLHSAAAQALPPRAQQQVVGAARQLLGTPYRLGGRLRSSSDGIDCQGVVFFALQPFSSCGWKSYSVYPTASLPSGELGTKLGGVVATRDVAKLLLEPGDVVWLVGFSENPAEGPIGTIDDQPVWVWHMGLVTEAHRFIQADFFLGEVREGELDTFLREHDSSYAGVIVTRIKDRPHPQRCRRHAPMLPPMLPPRGP